MHLLPIESDNFSATRLSSRGPSLFARGAGSRALSRSASTSAATRRRRSEPPKARPPLLPPSPRRPSPLERPFASPTSAAGPGGVRSRGSRCLSSARDENFGRTGVPGSKRAGVVSSIRDEGAGSLAAVGRQPSAPRRRTAERHVISFGRQRSAPATFIVGRAQKLT